MSELVVKSNKLNSVIQSLSLSEIRIVQLGIINARETGQGLTSESPLVIKAMAYAEAFDVDKTTAYRVLKQAETKLFNRQFSFIDEKGKTVKSHWLQRVRYLKDEGAIEVIFTVDVVNEISRLDGTEQFFTSYLLEQTANMKSNYSVRLYELLVQWKKATKTPLFELENFRGQLGLGVSEYKAMCNFKARVLDIAVKEINEKSDLKVSYKQEKKGRKIIGFKFIIRTNENKQKTINSNRDSDTPDMFNGMTEKQIDTFASKLAHDDIFSTRTFVAPVGADMSSYILSIKQNLASTMFQELWAKDLKRVGFMTK